MEQIDSAVVQAARPDHAVQHLEGAHSCMRLDSSARVVDQTSILVSLPNLQLPVFQNLQIVIMSTRPPPCAPTALTPFTDLCSVAENWLCHLTGVYCLDAVVLPKDNATFRCKLVDPALFQLIASVGACNVSSGSEVGDEIIGELFRLQLSRE